jgi:hypothetical protein
MREGAVEGLLIMAGLRFGCIREDADEAVARLNAIHMEMSE